MTSYHVAISHGEFYCDILDEQRLERDYFISNSRHEFMSAVTRYFNHTHRLTEEELDQRINKFNKFFS